MHRRVKEAAVVDFVVGVDFVWVLASFVCVCVCITNSCLHGEWWLALGVGHIVLEENTCYGRSDV